MLSILINSVDFLPMLRVESESYSRLHYTHFLHVSSEFLTVPVTYNKILVYVFSIQSLLHGALKAPVLASLYPALNLHRISLVLYRSLYMRNFDSS
jgi:hypothetical protein